MPSRVRVTAIRGPWDQRTPGTVKTTTCAPVIIGQRLRRSACGSPGGAAKLIGDVLAYVKRCGAPRVHGFCSVSIPRFTVTPA